MADEVEIGIEQPRGRARLIDVVEDAPPERLVRTDMDSYAVTGDEETLGELKPDSDLDDRTDRALTARVQSYQKAQDLDWLTKQAEPQASAIPENRASWSSMEDWRRDTEAWERVTPFEKTYGPKSATPVRDFVKNVQEGKAEGDIGYGILSLSETPRQMAGGVRDAAQSTYDFLKWFDQYAEPLPEFRGTRLAGRAVTPALSAAGDAGESMFKFLDEADQWIEPFPNYRITRRLQRKLGADGLPDVPDVGFEELPEVAEPHTAFGSVVRHITQFLRPFA